jgi:hypothetical protein
MPVIAAAAGGKLLEWALKLWWLWLAIGLFIGGAVWLNVHDARVARAAKAEVEAKLTVCETQRREAALAVQEAREAIGKLEAGYAKQAAEMEQLRQAEAAAKARGDRAVAQALAKQRALLAKIDELKAEAAKPAATPEMSCAEADAILRDLAARRTTGAR